jgi:hypothetical protein
METNFYAMENWIRASLRSAIIVIVLQVAALAADSANPDEKEYKSTVNIYIHFEDLPVPQAITKDPSKAVFEIIEFCKVQDYPAAQGLCLRALGRALASFKVTDKAATAAREELSDALKSDNAEVRENAMQTITLLDKDKATDILLKQVDDPSPIVQARAFELLGLYGDPKMAPRLQEILKRRADAAKDNPQRAAAEYYVQKDGAVAVAKMRARGSNGNSKP